MAHYKTLKKTHAVIVKQPAIYYERFKTGDRKGKVKRQRQIQYVEGLDTIFVDEQRKLIDKPVATHIYITKGVLNVEDENITKKALMDAHPDNEANGGNLYKLVDVVNDELYQIKELEKLDKAKASLSEADDNLIRTVAAWFLGTSYITQRVSKLKLTLRNKLEMNLKLTDGKTLFVDAFTNFMAEENNQEKLMVTLALKEEIIKIIDGKTIAWAEFDDPIYTGSQATFIVREFATWVKNDEEGRNVLKLIAEKISNI